MSMQRIHVVSPSASYPQQLCLPKSLSPTYLIGIVASSRKMPMLSPQAKLPTARVPNMEPRRCMEIPVLHKESPRCRATSVGESLAPLVRSGRPSGITFTRRANQDGRAS